MRYRVVSVAALAFFFSSSGSLADEPLPWAFNAPRAEGYSIDLITVDPVPATALKAGASVTFSVKVKYTLTIAPQGDIVLVFEDGDNRNVMPGTSQQIAEIHDKSGEVSLTQTIVVPENITELRLFIPIVPDGVKNTTGEITLRYPVEK